MLDIIMLFFNFVNGIALCEAEVGTGKTHEQHRKGCITLHHLERGDEFMKIKLSGRELDVMTVLWGAKIDNDVSTIGLIAALLEQEDNEEDGGG